MDESLLSLVIALAAKERGASLDEAVQIAAEVTQAIGELPYVDTMAIMMVVDRVFMDYGYPSR